MDDHVDDGNAFSDVEDPGSLLRKPRQVCALAYDWHQNFSLNLILLLYLRGPVIPFCR